jgi:hypothetical protein
MEFQGLQWNNFRYKLSYSHFVNMQTMYTHPCKSTHKHHLASNQHIHQGFLCANHNIYTLLCYDQKCFTKLIQFHLTNLLFNFIEHIASVSKFPYHRFSYRLETVQLLNICTEEFIQTNHNGLEINICYGK